MVCVALITGKRYQMDMCHDEQKVDVFVACKITGFLLPHTRDMALYDAVRLSGKLEDKGQVVVMKLTDDRFSGGFPFLYVSLDATRCKATRHLTEEALHTPDGHTWSCAAQLI